MKKAVSLILTFLLVLTLVPGSAFAYSDAYGSEVWQEDTTIYGGVTLSDNIYWSHYYDKPRHEYFVTVDSSSKVMPTVAYGASVCDRITASDAAAMYEAQGWRVVAGINGDFYDTATGYPLGLMITDGEVISGGAGNYALGFREDGSAIIGEPNLTITAEYRDKTIRIASINKPRVDHAGITLLTSDFNNEHTTGTHTEGLTVI